MPTKPKQTGRTREYDDAARISVRLTAAQLAIAKRLGNGDASAGIRLALEKSAKDKSKIPQNDP